MVLLLTTETRASPWNYPFILTFDPFVGALAAGCTALLKPSESTPTCSALMASLVSKYLDPNAYAVVNGAVKETTAVLDLRWDHIFFTGGTKVGKVVATAAAKFVTPVTLELGGKSPVIIDPSCDMELAAKRVLYGKLQNSGQLCVTPDYVLVPKNIIKDFQEAVKKTYQQFWPKTPLHPDAQWGKMVNRHHHARVKNLIDKTKGEIILGGEVDGDRRIALTVVRNIEKADSLMEEFVYEPALKVLANRNLGKISVLCCLYSKSPTSMKPSV